MWTAAILPSWSMMNVVGNRSDSSVTPRNLVSANRNAVVHIVRCHERPHGLPAVFIHRDAKHGKTSVFILGLERDEPWNLDLAWTAPCSPEIEKHDPALVIGKLDRGAFS